MGRGALWRDNQQSTFAHIHTSSSHSTTSSWSPIPYPHCVSTAVVVAVVAASEISQTPCMLSSCIVGHVESDAAATAMQTRTCHVRAGHVRDTYVTTLPAGRDVGGDASLVLGGEAASFEVTRVRRGGGMLRGVGVLLLERSRGVFLSHHPHFLTLDASLLSLRNRGCVRGQRCGTAGIATDAASISCVP